LGSLQCDRYGQQGRHIAIATPIELVDRGLGVVEQMLGRQFVGALVARVSNAGERFCRFVYQAADADLIKRASICGVGRFVEVKSSDGVIDSPSNILAVDRIELTYCSSYRDGLETRNADIHKMSVKATRSLRRTCRAALRTGFELADF